MPKSTSFLHDLAIEMTSGYKAAVFSNPAAKSDFNTNMTEIGKKPVQYKGIEQRQPSVMRRDFT